MLSSHGPRPVKNTTQARTTNTSSTQPEPELLESITRDLHRPNLRIERRLTAPYIRFRRVDHLGSLEHLPESKEETKDRNTNIGCEEVGQLIRSPGSGGEDLEAVEENDEGEVDKGRPGDIRLPLAREDHGVAVDVLGNACLAEPGVCVGNSAPSEERGDCGQVLEPPEHLVGTSADTHVCEQGDGGRDCDSIDRYTLLVAPKKELGSLAVLGNTEEITRSGVQESIAGRGRGSQDDSVDDVRKNWNTSVLHRDDPGRRLGTFGVGIGECRVVRANGGTNDERS